MRKIVFPFMLMILLMTGCGGEQGNISVDTHKNLGKVIIGIDDDFAPIAFRDKNNALVGFDVELAEETFRRMGVAIEFKPIDWEKKREALTSGSVDLIWNGLDITDERKEYMIFSKPYMDDRQILLVRHDSDLNIHSEYDLEGKVVGAQAGSASDDHINSDQDLKSKLKVYKVYDKFKTLLDALRNEEIEVIICDELVARYEMNMHPDSLKIIDVRIGAITETGIGFAKDNVELRDKVQAAFDEVIADGTAKKISERWFQADLIKSHR